jgi:hypothetical protein
MSRPDLASMIAGAFPGPEPRETRGREGGLDYVLYRRNFIRVWEARLNSAKLLRLLLPRFGPVNLRGFAGVACS